MRRIFILMLCCSAFWVSCDEKDEDNNPPPATAGTVNGSVNLYDEDINEIDPTGMTIRTDENNDVKTTTDGAGEFSLENLPFGTYTIVYEKDGYGTFRKYEIEHQSSTGNITFITENPSLGQFSTTEVINLTATENNDVVTISATTSPDGSQADTRYIRYFFSTSADVSNENYDAVLETFPVNINPYNLNLNDESFKALGFSSGTTVYTKCYGESFWSNSYEDPKLGRTIFPNLNQNSAASVEFVVP